MVYTVGAYRLLRQIGEGGMGVVHLALAPDGSRVAVKILRSQVIGDREARQRLEREVAAMRRVRSPRVAEFVDAEPWGEPPYVVTRYVAGLSLTEYVAEYGPLDDVRLHRFAIGTAQALAGVHAAGVLHRDVKPSNVLIDRDEPVLIDFGLAMSGDESRMTHAGWIFGTPAYLSPEVVLGEAPTLAVDVHGWAATVGFAATGRSPYGSGPSVVVLDRIRRGDYSLGGVPEPLASVARQCLDPQPHQRPTATQLCQWLQTLPGQVAATPGRSYPHAAAPVTDRWASVSSVGHPLGEPDAGVPGAGRTLAAPRSVRPAEHSMRTTFPGSSSGPTAAPAGSRPSGAGHGHPAASYAGAYAPMGHQLHAGSAAPWSPEATPTGTRVLQWLAGFATTALLAGALAAAPYVTAALVVVGLVLVRATITTSDRRHRLVHRRGPRGRDGLVSVLIWPWHALLSLPLAVVACSAALVIAMAISAIQTVVAGSATDASTVLGGLAFAALLWWGPAHLLLRRTGQASTRLMLTPPVAGVVTTFVLVTAAVAVLVLADDTATVWAPIDEAPWRVLERVF